MNKMHQSILAVSMLGLFLSACQPPDYITPNTNFTPTNLSANFLLVNAISDATVPDLDFYLNNVKTGSSVVRIAGTGSSYANLPLPSNGVLANTAIRAKATTGTIGGVLGSNDLIFRAGSTNTTNFTAFDSAYYTVIALDSLTRPKPLRTFNALGIGDTTYFNPLTGSYMAGRDTWALPLAQKSRRVPIGTVPLGITDPGGSRFLIITDQLPLPSTTRFPKPVAGKFALRFIHAAPDVGGVTVTVGGTTLNSGITTYPMRASGSFNPAVGSRTTTASFKNDFANIGTLNITVTAGASTATLNGYIFADRGVYTIVLYGQKNKANLGITVIKNK